MHYKKEYSDVLKEVDSTINGISEEEAKNRLNRNGYNELKEASKVPIWKIFLESFKDPLVIILLIAAIVQIFLGEFVESIIIFVVVILNSVLGVTQTRKAESSLDSLKKLSSPNAKVLRAGKKKTIPVREIVVGDIEFLEAGDYIPADGRIIEAQTLKVVEGMLTGEAEAVLKHSDKIGEEVGIGDQRNMVFSGATVVYGRGTLVVTATGMNTEVGKVATLLETAGNKQTPLQVKLDEFGKKLGIIIMILAAIIFGIQVVRGYISGDNMKTLIFDSFMFAIAVAVAAIPEALSSIVTIVLAVGTKDMAKKQAIIRKLPAVETLGSTSAICTDKTGTLTQNKMTVVDFFMYGVNKEEIQEENNDSNQIEAINLSSTLCNDSEITDTGKEIGDPTEVALVNLGHDILINELELRNEYKRLAEIPFDSNRKLMSTLHKIDNKNVMFTKGALDVILDRVKFIMTSEGVRELTDSDKSEILDVNRRLSESGLRVLSFAYKELDEIKELTLDDEYSYTFIGLISMIDPPREESKQAVEDCIMAGIKPIMITGDHKITASAIAKEIGILRDGDRAIEGLEIDKMSDEELKENIEHISVYARVSPEHKIRIVRAWQEKGQIVAMTGDGVNDAPALKQADIGIAMGITGTEVSKDAASVILTDDNFATIVKSVSNGRSIYSNIKNSIKFLLSGNTSGIIAVLYSSIMALPMPFAAVHLLFINLLTDSLPAIAIGMEESNRDLLKDKPRSKNESILNKNFLFGLGLEGLLIGMFTIIAFYAGNPMKTPLTASTMAFATLCLARLFHGFNCRGKGSIFKLGVFSNKYVWYAFGIGLVLLNAVLFVPFLQGLFEVENLMLSQYVTIYILAFIPTLIIQFIKIINEVIENRKVKKNPSGKFENNLKNIA